MQVKAKRIYNFMTLSEFSPSFTIQKSKKTYEYRYNRCQQGNRKSHC